MKFHTLSLSGAFLIEPELKSDERGFFARTWCSQEAQERGISESLVQCSISFNRSRGTLRGLHFQSAPFAEGKLVRCTAGCIYDVMLDLREGSPTFSRWEAFELSSDNRLALYIPQGVAHGFQTLANNSEVFYQMTEYYHPEVSKGVRWNDQAFGIAWPIDEPILSDRDRSFPNFKP